MRITQEMDNLKKGDFRRYSAAHKLLEDILIKRQPDFGLLAFLYGEDRAINMAESIYTFYSNPEFVPGKIRRHDNAAPEILSDARKCVDDDKDFQKIETYLSPQIKRTESIEYLVKEIQSKIGAHIQNKFGPYTDYVIKESALAIHHRLKRKCKISTVSHWMGAAGLMYFLQVNNHIPTLSDPYFRVMVAFSHDFKEDLPRVVLNSNKEPYGLYRTEEFGRDHLPLKPVELIRNINILTNLYTEVPKYAYESIKSQGSALTQDKFKKFLTDYMTAEKRANHTYKDVDSPMYKVHSNLSKFMSEKNYGSMSDKELLDAISWDTYDFYVKRIVKKSIKFEDDTPIIAKFCDQSYNFMGKEILSDEDLTQNLQKLWLWASVVYDSAIDLPHTNNFVRELLEDALCYSEYYIIKDFMKREANILFNTSKFNKIIDLSPILYTDKKLSGGLILPNSTSHAA